jgi:hypothetical protein
MTRRSLGILVVALCCLLAAATSAWAEEDTLALVTGNKYQEISDSARAFYVMGAVEGMYFEAAHVKFSPDVLVLGGCVSGRTGLQLRAIVDKYTAAHPELWHKPMSTLVYRAVISGCEEALREPKVK